MVNREWVIGSLSAAPGKKTAGVQEITIAGKPYALPMFLINGEQEGPTLAVTGGIHGAEYASIAAALELGRQLEPGGLRGRVVVVPVVNVPAFRARSIYICPLDGVNLNRVFPGKADGTASEQIAHWLFQNVMQPANYYLDLHGGDLVEALVPFTIYTRTGNQAVDDVSLEMAKAFGIRYIVKSASLSGSTYAAAASAGIPAILTESGAQGIWPRKAVDLHTNGVDRLMRHLGMLPGPAPEQVSVTLFDRSVWLRSQQDGFWYPKALIDEVVQKGQDLGAVMDFQGNVLQPVEAPDSGCVLFVVSSLAINQGDPLVSIGVQ